MKETRTAYYYAKNALDSAAITARVSASIVERDQATAMMPGLRRACESLVSILGYTPNDTDLQEEMEHLAY